MFCCFKNTPNPDEDDKENQNQEILKEFDFTHNNEDIYKNIKVATK